MKILLTGATGFLGYRTLEKLVAEQVVERITATGRTIRESHQVLHPKVKYQLGDLTDPDFADSLVEQADHIIHAAALSSPWGQYTDFEEANVRTQRNLIGSAQYHNIKKYIYISSPSVYFNSRDRLNIKEADPLPRTFANAYAATKRIAEVMLENADLPYVILRPRALIGRGDTVIMPRLIRAYNEGRLKIIGDGKNIADLTPVANVADAIFLSLTAKPTALNNTYNITNGAPVKLWEAIADVLRKLEKVPPSKKVPFWLVNALARLMELKSRVTPMAEPALTTYSVGTLAKSMTLDISKAKDLLGFEPNMSIDEAVTEFVNWYKAHGES
jgi:nucleoside-diphosphate-sugar epimerase